MTVEHGRSLNYRGWYHFRDKSWQANHTAWQRNRYVFFDTCDEARRAHSKKRNSPFASSNQEALSTWADVLAAKEAEEELELWVRNNKGWDAWQLMLQIRREVNEERKREEALRIKRRAELQEQMAIVAVIILSAIAIFGGFYLFCIYMGWLTW